MIYGIPPFYSTDVDKMYKKTVKKKLKFKKYVQCSDECKDFLSRILQKKVENRLGFIADSLEVMSHEWFKHFKWDELTAQTLTPPYNPLKEGESWEGNFDPEFVKFKAEDSECLDDAESLKEFAKDFELFQYHKLEEEERKKGEEETAEEKDGLLGKEELKKCR